MRKACNSLLKSSLTLFSCEIRAMYNRFNREQKQHIMLNSYIPGINISIFPKKNYNNIFSEN